MQPKQIKFEHPLAVLIENGQKTSAFRFYDEKDIRVGDVLEVVDKCERDNPSSWQIIGTAQVTEVLEKLLKNLTSADWEGHEAYPSHDVFLETVQSYNKQPITEDTPLKIIRFNFEKFSENRPYLYAGSAGQLPTEVKLYADGGSRGNPGPSAGGYVILDMNDVVLRESSKYLGITTNNQAEYHAVKGGLEQCLKERAQIVHVYMDSLLVVNQMKGVFKIKNRELWGLNESVKKLAAQFKEINFTHVPRELNRLADAEVNKALDAIKEDEVHV